MLLAFCRECMEYLENQAYLLVILFLALIMELYFTEQLNIRAVLIISLAAILTFSTAAYILVSILLVGYFTKQLFGSSHKKQKGF